MKSDISRMRVSFHLQSRYSSSETDFIMENKDFFKAMKKNQKEDDKAQDDDEDDDDDA